MLALTKSRIAQSAERIALKPKIIIVECWNVEMMVLNNKPNIPFFLESILMNS
jgi:hypothetical protein